MKSPPSPARETPRPDTGDLLPAIRDLFRPPAGAAEDPRVGLEAEFIPVRADDRHAVPPGDGSGPGTLAPLLRHAHREGWRRLDPGTGLPAFLLADGSRLSYEPGGQIEYATRPVSSLDDLDGLLEACLLPLGRALEAEGIRLLARGLDPVTPPSAVRRVLEGERYPRQEAHYARRGPAGRTMMLQTAGVHVNVDPGPDPVASWNRANALVPHLVALFANAPSPPGSDTPARSRRAGLWRVLDPTRNTVFPPSAEPWLPYLEFALDADAFLLGDAARRARSFRRWYGDGVGLRAFADHLTTLFPEVRPRRYLEIRSVDALPLQWCVVPAALGMAVALTRSGREPDGGGSFPGLPPATRERLVAAGTRGLGDPGLAGECLAVRDWLLATLDRAGAAVASRGILRRVEDFFRAGLDRGRDPGHRADSWLES